jgi:mannose-1-phosphate guanylyltransferase/mannose-6-phosphate isomerase
VELAAEGWIVTIGVLPTHGSEAFGYITPGETISTSSGARRVNRFVEKPNRERASTLVADGALWNAGIFVMSIRELISAFSCHAPDILTSCRIAKSNGRQIGNSAYPDASMYAQIRAEPFDRAVLEKHEHLAVVPIGCAWNDIGSWNAIAELNAAAPANPNVLLVECRDTFVYPPSRLTVVIGLEDLLVVDTPDALLVAKKSDNERLREVVNLLVGQKRPEAIQQKRIVRPWGAYECVNLESHGEVKTITVKPAHTLSIQFSRKAHWIIVRGNAKVTSGNATSFVQENESISLLPGIVHALENLDRIPLELIEVQTGYYLAKASDPPGSQ